MTKTKATFIEPMLLLRTEKLPHGADWLYEIKLDGYRAQAIKSGGKVQLRSRNDNDFTERYAPITSALRAMPDETVLDGEVTALDEEGRPSFNLLQNYVASKPPLVFFVFDALILMEPQGHDGAAERAEGASGKARPSKTRGAHPLFSGTGSQSFRIDRIGDIGGPGRAGRETPQQSL